MRRAAAAAFLSGLSLCGAAAATTPPGAPAARKIPGITAEDPFPKGCVDCHVADPRAKRDPRFTSLLKEWSVKVDAALLAKAQGAAPAGVTLKGKHPAVTASLKDVPGKCLPCHGKSSKTAPAFGDLMHALHLTGGEKSAFLTVFQGECTHCHKLDAKTGRWKIPSGPAK